MGDDAWIFDDAVTCNDTYVDKGSSLFGEFVACGNACASQNPVLSAHARVEDDAYTQGSSLCGRARVSDCGMVLDSPDVGRAPISPGTSTVYGRVCGDTHLIDIVLIISGEEIHNDSLNTLVMGGKGRFVIRDPSKNELTPQKPEPQQRGHKEQGQGR